MFATRDAIAWAIFHCPKIHLLALGAASYKMLSPSCCNFDFDILCNFMHCSAFRLPGRRMPIHCSVHYAYTYLYAQIFTQNEIIHDSVCASGRCVNYDPVTQRQPNPFEFQLNRNCAWIKPKKKMKTEHMVTFY